MAILKGKKVTPETSKTGGVRYSSNSKQREVDEGRSSEDSSGSSGRNLRYTSPEQYGLELYGNSDRTFTEQDADKIRTDTQKRFQGQLDLIDQRFMQNIQGLKTEGTDRLGRQRAMSSRGGLIGSARGEAQRTGVEGYNRQLEQQEENRRNTEVASIYEKIDLRSQEAINARKEEIKGNAEAYLDFLSKSRDSVREDLKTLATNGVNLDDLDPSDVDDLMEQGGFQSRFMLEQYVNANKPKAEQTDWQYKTVGNQIIAYGVDPATGELKQMNEELPFDVPANYKVQTLANGQIMFVPDEFDPTKSPQEQVIFYGAEGQFNKDGLSSDTEEGDTKRLILDELDRLEGMSGKGGAIGAGFQKIFGEPRAGSAAASYLSQLETVKALLTLPNLGLLKGPMSDSDRRFISATAGALSDTMKEEEFDKSLAAIRKRLEKAESGSRSADAGGSDEEDYQPGDEVPLGDGGYAIVADDGETLLDPATMQPIQN